MFGRSKKNSGTNAKSNSSSAKNSANNSSKNSATNSSSNAKNSTNSKSNARNSFGAKNNAKPHNCSRQYQCNPPRDQAESRKDKNWPSCLNMRKTGERLQSKPY